MLESLGLSATAEAVYRTMLTHREWGVAQIAEHLDLSRAAVRAALDQLSKLTLLGDPGGAPDQPRPVDPAVGLAALLARAEAEVLARRQQIDLTRAVIAALVAEHPGGRTAPADVVTHDGVDAVRDRLRALSGQVVRECVSLNPNLSQTPDAKDASRPLNERMLARGVAMRCVYQESFRNDPHLLAYARWLTDAGGQARTAPTVPLLMIIYDREIAVLPLDPADTRRGALEVRSPGIVALAYALFEQLWAEALPFGQAATRADDGLDATDRQLLLLLAAGHTDELAARRLGVSVSTVRRQMSALMDRLSARSRFQAGVQAAERGWLRQTPSAPAVG